MEDFISPHPSGCGAYIVPPAGVPYRVFRSDVRKGLGGTQGLILEGIASRGTRYLDFDAPIGKEVTYRIEFEGKTIERTIRSEPQNTYSAVNDADMEDSPNPRDALVVYYATRLAQLVKKNKLIVFKKEGEEESNHAKRYSVRSSYHLEESELPILVLDYSDGETQGLDIGHTMTETTFRIEAFFAATSREERDSARQAIVGLWRDTEWFLEDIGAYESSLIDMTHRTQEESIPFYILEFSIVGRYAFDQSARGSKWELLRGVMWHAKDQE